MVTCIYIAIATQKKRQRYFLFYHRNMYTYTTQLYIYFREDIAYRKGKVVEKKIIVVVGWRTMIKDKMRKRYAFFECVLQWWYYRELRGCKQGWLSVCLLSTLYRAPSESSYASFMRQPIQGVQPTSQRTLRTIRESIVKSLTLAYSLCKTMYIHCHSHLYFTMWILTPTWTQFCSCRIFIFYAFTLHSELLILCKIKKSE